MSCYSVHLTLPQALIATFATLPFLFAPQAWAAPHSNLVRRSGSISGSQIVVRPLIVCMFPAQQTIHLGSRRCCSRFPRRHCNIVLQE